MWRKHKTNEGGTEDRGGDINVTHTNDLPTAQHIKCIIAGDGTIGKTSLLLRYAKGEFHTEYVPTVVDSWACRVVVDSLEVDLEIWDTAGQEDLSRIRPLAYAQADTYILCFAIDNPASVENILSKWFPEVSHYCPQSPFVLVGTKMDMRLEKNGECKLVSYEEGLSLYTELKTRSGGKCIRYMECSSVTGQGLKVIFEEAIRGVFQSRIEAKEEMKEKCVIL